jgi:hypothetical protein
MPCSMKAADCCVLRMLVAWPPPITTSHQASPQEDTIEPRAHPCRDDCGVQLTGQEARVALAQVLTKRPQLICPPHGELAIGLLASVQGLQVWGRGVVLGQGLERGGRWQLGTPEAPEFGAVPDHGADRLMMHAGMHDMNAEGSTDKEIPWHRTLAIGARSPCRTITMICCHKRVIVTILRHACANCAELPNARESCMLTTTSTRAPAQIERGGYAACWRELACTHAVLTLSFM